MLFLVKLTLAWGIFALVYALSLRRETFFRANRAYLMGTLLLGLALAWTDTLPTWWHMMGVPKNTVGGGVFWTNPVLTISARQADLVQHTGALVNWLYWIWLIVCLVGSIRLLYGLFALIGLIRTGRKEYLPGGICLVHSPAIALPCSFFHWVLLPASSPTSDPILAHECAHARAWHSVDVLLLELVTVFCWFHPLIYWYRRALRTIHEYEADATAARLITKKQYGLLLIGQTQSGMPLGIVNHFFQSPLKQRLFMLTKKTSSTKAMWKYALIVPALAFVLTLCQTTLLVAQIQKDNEDRALSEVEVLPQFPGGQSALMTFLSENIKYPEAARTSKAEGKVAVSFVVDRDGSIIQVKGIEGAQFRSEFLEEAVRVVKMMPKWSPAIAEGMPVRCRYTLPIKFKLD